MRATRILLLLQTLATLLLVLVSGCSKTCQVFVGMNGCCNNGITEPKLPPRDNACCGPHCVYRAPNPPVACSNTKTNRCLLDTSCSQGLPFSFVSMSGCQLQKTNNGRILMGYAPLLSFNFNQTYCKQLNTKCGLNCCCRETCPKRFCKF